MLRALFVGDVVGKPGRRLAAEFVPQFRRLGVSIVILNGENAAGGSGLSRSVVEELFESGADVITSGDHFFRNKEVMELISEQPRVLRPANISPRALGFGATIIDTEFGAVAVINIIGRTFMQPAECPFFTIDRLLSSVASKAKVVFVDFHAEATSEKVAMGQYLDGRVSVLVGTHTHIQTADEQILRGGTAYITDLGMTGPYGSVIGRESEPVLFAFTTGMPARFSVSTDLPRFCGAVVDIDENTGKATAIKRVSINAGESIGEEVFG